jgi:hypothetical protein
MNRRERKAVQKYLNNPAQAKKDANAVRNRAKKAVEYNRKKGVFLRGRIFVALLILFLVSICFL